MILTMDTNQLRGRMAASSRHFRERRVDPRGADVLLGRGHSLHPGNLAYRRIICKYLPTYSAAKTNKEKTKITKQIVAQVRRSGGRFLKEDPHGDKMLEMGDDNVRLRVGQALRHQLRIIDHKDTTQATVATQAEMPQPNDNGDSTFEPLFDRTSEVIFAEDQLSGDSALVNNASAAKEDDTESAQMKPEEVQSRPNPHPMNQMIGGTSDVPIDVDNIIDDHLMQGIDLVEGDFGVLDGQPQHNHVPKMSQPPVGDSAIRNLIQNPLQAMNALLRENEARGETKTLPVLHRSTSGAQQDNRLVHINHSPIPNEHGNNILGL
mmetsp:Transcript_6181/g.12717  ORF Transcript_6181/g.12717 Transcript_6181/m.12717 type:complete len:321 (+) Transcript_6181:220-1182(+)